MKDRGIHRAASACDEYFAELALWFGVAPGELATVFPNIGRFYGPIAGPRMPIGFLNRP